MEPTVAKKGKLVSSESTSRATATRMAPPLP
ncbi:hypothetical protein VCHC57A2_1912, partial [Vibrio cholerae HC-57A2]